MISETFDRTILLDHHHPAPDKKEGDAKLRVPPGKRDFVSGARGWLASARDVFSDGRRAKVRCRAIRHSEQSDRHRCWVRVQSVRHYHRHSWERGDRLRSSARDGYIQGSRHHSLVPDDCNWETGHHRSSVRGGHYRNSALTACRSSFPDGCHSCRRCHKSVASQSAAAY
jgi:hypothetical protein